MTNKKNKFKLHKNILREFSNFIMNRSLKDKIKGLYYGFVHYLLLIMGAFILLFSTNKFHLILLLILISLDSFSIVVLHHCPLTILEQKYTGVNVCETRMKILNKLGIVYKCNHVYEYQLELLINFWTITSIKIMFLILLDFFYGYKHL